MDIIIVILACAVCISAGFLFSFLRSKGKIDEKSVKLTIDLLLMAKIIANKYVDNGRKELVSTIFEIIRNAIDYAVKQDKIDKAERKQLAYATIITNLRLMDIEVDYETELLIEIVLEHALNIEIKPVQK